MVLESGLDDQIPIAVVMLWFAREGRTHVEGKVVVQVQLDQTNVRRSLWKYRGRIMAARVDGRWGWHKRRRFILRCGSSPVHGRILKWAT